MQLSLAAIPSEQSNPREESKHPGRRSSAQERGRGLRPDGPRGTRRRGNAPFEPTRGEERPRSRNFTHHEGIHNKSAYPSRIRDEVSCPLGGRARRHAEPQELAE